MIIKAQQFTHYHQPIILSDEDSGDESEDNDINHLSGNQLLAEGQLRATMITRNGLQEVTFGYEDWEESTELDHTAAAEVPQSSSNLVPHEPILPDNQREEIDSAMELRPSTSLEANAGCSSKIKQKALTMTPSLSRPKRKQSNAVKINSKKPKTLDNIKENVVTKVIITKNTTHRPQNPKKQVKYQKLRLKKK